MLQNQLLNEALNFGAYEYRGRAAASWIKALRSTLRVDVGAVAETPARRSRRSLLLMPPGVRCRNVRLWR